MYRTCTGCTLQGQPCAARDLVKAQVRGLHVTSIRWKCEERKPRFAPGDAVWVKTSAGGDQVSRYGDHEMIIAEFPGHVIEQVGSKLRVFVQPGAKSSEEEDVEFITTGRGFCKIPFGRIRERTGEWQPMCATCEMPAHLGHDQGCDHPASKLQMCGERTGCATCIRPKGHPGEHDDIPF